MSLLHNFKPRTCPPLTPPEPFVRGSVVPTKHTVTDADGNTIAERIVNEPVFSPVPASELSHENETAEMYSIQNQIENGFDMSLVTKPFFKQTIDDAENVADSMAKYDYDKMINNPKNLTENETNGETGGTE